MFKLIKDHVEQDAKLTLLCRAIKDDFCECIQWSVANRGTTTFRGVFRLALELGQEWSAPWVMVPGFFYGENRRADQLGRFYPRFDPALDKPADMISSWWDFAADRTSSPLVYLHEDNRCLALASAPHVTTSPDAMSEDPEPQIGVGFGWTKGRGTIRFSFPACEEPFTYNSEPEYGPTIRRLSLPPGGHVAGQAWLYRFAGDRHGYQRVLEHYNRLMSPEHPPADTPALQPIVRDALYGICTGHYHEKGNFFVYSRCYDAVAEQLANARETSVEWYQDMVGFVGGLMVCRGLLQGAAMTGDKNARAIAHRVANRICRDGISPSGLFWADYVPPRIETENGVFPNPLAKNRGEYGTGWLDLPDCVHSRTIADACDHLAGMIALESSTGRETKTLTLWQQAIEGNLRAALALQLPNGAYGQYYNAVTGTVVKKGGCGGLLWIPAMLKACRLELGDEALRTRMRESALRAGAAYAPYVEREYIWGAPEDNDSPTSEDGMNAVMAYCDLYEATQEDRWLALARRAADWTLTFRKTYNQRIAKETLIGRYAMRSRGGDFASVSNNHLHVFEALCTRHLCNLSRWTGNSYYRERAADHWAFVCQYLCRCDGMYNGFRGAMSEQFYWTNWGSWGGTYRLPRHHRQKGNLAGFSAVWCVAIIPLAAPDILREFGDGE